METRQTKGIQIFKEKAIKPMNGGWEVKSQSSNKNYFVDQFYRCDCPDCQLNGTNPCKHAYAVKYYLGIEKADGTTEKIRLTYPQAWHAYNAAQQSEVTMFDKLLKDLIAEVPELEYVFGRPSLSRKEVMFCAIQKVYSQLSSRRAKSLFNKAVEAEQLNHSPNFNAVSKLLKQEDTTPLLQELLIKTALPLKSVETQFAIDSSGFTTNGFTSYCNEKHGINRKHDFLKAHICVGTKTNIITSALVTKGNEGDANHMQELVAQTSENFNALEYSADKGYSSRANMQFISDNGAKPYILFKKGTKPKGFGTNAWRNAWHYFELHQEEFMEHYHKRSNVESTFKMIKMKLGETLKSKNPTAQKNELLCKLIAHNIIVLIHEIHELGVEAKF